MTDDAQAQSYLRQIESANVPDVTDTSYQAQLAALGDYAQTAFNEVLAQYRFMGLVCGIKSGDDTDEDVEKARNAIMEAISGFLHPEGGPIHAQIGEEYGRYMRMRDAHGLEDRFGDESATYIRNTLPGISLGNPTDTASYATEIANGSRTPNTATAVRRGALSPEAAAYIAEAAEAYRRANELELIRREMVSERFRQWWQGVWDGVRSYYDENMELIRNGQWLLATGRIAIDAMIFAAEEIVITGLIVGIVAVTGGLAAGIMLALRAALRAALSVVRMGTRTVRRVNATWDFKIELRKVEPGVLYSNPIPVNVTIGRKLDFEHRVDVEKDLTPDERRAMGEGGEGSTRPDADAAENGDAGDSGVNLDDPPDFQHPRANDPARSRDELLPNGRVPRDPEFETWWDDLSPKEHEALWGDGKNPTARRMRETVLGNRRTHEWLKRSQLQKLKELGFSMREIRQFTTPTRQTGGPDPRRPGTEWRHNPEGGGKGSGVGSGTMHKSLDKIIADARSRNDLLRRYGYWANSWLRNGIDDLPAPMRDAIVSAGGG